jgi:hypothetical protein
MAALVCGERSNRRVAFRGRRILISKVAFGLVHVTECVSRNGGAEPRVHIREVIRLVTKEIRSLALFQNTQEQIRQESNYQLSLSSRKMTGVLGRGGEELN